MKKMARRKKKSLGFKIFAGILSFVLIGLSAFLIWEVLALNILSTKLLIPVIVILVLLDLIFLILIWNSKKTVGRVFSSLFVVLLCGVYGFGSVYIMNTHQMLDSITSITGKVKNTVSVLTLKEDSLEELEDLDGKSLGYLKTIDTYGTEQLLKKAGKDLGYDSKKTGMVLDVLAQEEEKESKEKEEKDTISKEYSYLPFDEVGYESLQQMVKALYEEEIDAIILNSVYVSNVTEIEDYADFKEDTKTIYTVNYYTDSKNQALVVSDISTEPFNIFVSGNDTFGSVDELSRSDVNMIVTVNPTTSTVLLTSIPRDTYVESACDISDGCQAGAMDKLTHLGLHGVDASVDTVENLMGVDINYTFRVNFSSVTDIVNAIGGIDVFVEEGLSVDMFAANNTEGVHEGWNHLDGDRALAYARERYAYADGDNQRVRNQQQVLQAIVTQAISSDILVNYNSLMKAFSDAFETNMSTKEITQLIQYQLSANPDWKFETYQLDVVGDMMYCAELGQEASVSIPDMRSVQIAREKIEAVMNGESSESVDTDWLDTTSPVYNYWGNYDHDIDYRTDSDTTYYERETPNVDQGYEDTQEYDNSYIENGTQNYYDPYPSTDTSQDYYDPYPSTGNESQDYYDPNVSGGDTNQAYGDPTQSQEYYSSY